MSDVELHYQKGGALLITLVFLLVFLIIVIAWVQFTARQNHSIVDQEQEEQSFHIAEAGVHYSVFLLSSGACTPANLDASEPVVQTVTDDTGNEVGRYSMTYDVTPVGSDTRVTVTAIGYDKNLPSECQKVVATLRMFSGALGSFVEIESWDQKTFTGCGTLPIVTALSC